MPVTLGLSQSPFLTYGGDSEERRAKRSREKKIVMIMSKLLDPAITEAGTVTSRFLSQYLAFPV